MVEWIYQLNKRLRPPHQSINDFWWSSRITEFKNHFIPHAHYSYYTLSLSPRCQLSLPIFLNSLHFSYNKPSILGLLSLLVSTNIKTYCYQQDPIGKVQVRRPWTPNETAWLGLVSYGRQDCNSLLAL